MRPTRNLPLIGDTFTILAKWINLGSDGRFADIVYQSGEILTFGTQGLCWEAICAAVGVYVVSFIIGDLDGNSYPVYAQGTVK